MGIVVSKRTGKPVVGAQVALADAALGRLSLGFRAGRDPFVSGWGPDQEEALNSSRPEGPVELSGLSNRQGRFVLRHFRSMSSAYNVAAAHDRDGIGLATNVVPEKLGEQPLRIELDEPPVLVLPAPTRLVEPKAGLPVVGRLIPRDMPTTFDPESFVGDANLSNRLTTSVYYTAEAQRGDVRLPVFPGFRYYVSVQLTTPRTGGPATLLERVVNVDRGEVRLALAPTDGQTLRGRVSGEDAKPLRDVNVLVRTKDETRYVLGTSTDESGGYTLTGLPAGQHILEMTRYAIRTAPG
jgi:hypothetical protein